MAQSSHRINKLNVMAQTSKEGQLDITQPLGSFGCLWKLRMINGFYHHSHQHKIVQSSPTHKATKKNYLQFAHTNY